MKRYLIATFALVLACTHVDASDISRKDFSQRGVRREVRKLTRGGRYYIDKRTTVRLVERTEKTQGLRRRETTIYLLPKDMGEQPYKDSINTVACSL